MTPRRNVSQNRGRHERKTPPKTESTGFGVFRLSPSLLRSVEKLGWTTPTPVQKQAIPLALDGHDVIALAQTGTGKTGAFLLPLLENLSDMPPAKPRSPYCVIVVPTRELVQQIDAEVKSLSQGMRLRSMTIFGGVSERPQIAKLRSGVEIVAATPGRLLDLMGQGMIHLNRVEFCVLDEADRMFDMGFINDMKRILSEMPKQRQTLLFSATMPPEIQHLTREFLHHPREVRLSVSLPPPELKHEVWELTAPQKISALEYLLSQKHDSVLIFTRTKHRANSLSRRLERGGQNVAVLHGNRSQNQRDIALRRFKQGEARVLVATDVASRGLDIMGISLVINFDTPQDPGDYVHRVGRTARASRHGLAITFMVGDEIKYVQKIEQLLKQRIVRRKQGNRNNNYIPSTDDRREHDEKPEVSAEQNHHRSERKPKPDKPRKQRNRRQSAKRQDSQPGSGSRSGKQSNPRSKRQRDEQSTKREGPRKDENRDSRRGKSESNTYDGVSGSRSWRDEPPSKDRNTRR